MIFDPITWKVRFAFTGKLETMEEKIWWYFRKSVICNMYSEYILYVIAMHFLDGSLSGRNQDMIRSYAEKWQDSTHPKSHGKMNSTFENSQRSFLDKKTSESSEKKSPSTSFMYFLFMKNWDLKNDAKKDTIYIDLKHIAFLDPPKPLKTRACGQLFSHGSEWSPISKGSLNGVLISLISETVSAGHQTHHVRWFCLTLQRMRQNIYSFEGLSETKRLKNFYNTMNSTLRWQSQIVQWVSRLFMVSPSLN